MKISHTEKIRFHLKHYGSITAIEALNRYGCFRLSGRILELRLLGMPIKTNFIKNSDGKRFAKYTLEKS